MRKGWMVGCLLLALAAGAAAQDADERVRAAEALTPEACREIAARVMRRIEAYTRMRFRRPVPVHVQPRAAWEQARKADGYAGATAERGAAFYYPGQNYIVIVPWVIGNYAADEPTRMTRAAWSRVVQPTIIHELTHAIHFQNFYNDARTYEASLKAKGLTDDEIDHATMDYLLAEGFAELVSLRVAEDPMEVDRHPSVELPTGRQYFRRYEPNGKLPYRVLLFTHAYDDGLTLLHHFSMKAGSRGVRAVLYRPPPRRLFFFPDLLAQAELADPPEPDSVFGFLAPALLDGREVRLSLDPGHKRYFERAYASGRRAKGCLLGYTCRVEEARDGEEYARYAFYVADPDDPGTWQESQRASFAELAATQGRLESRTHRLPLLPRSAKERAEIASFEARGGGAKYVRGELGGLVVLAHETNPTRTLEDRVLLALRALWIRRPQPDPYGPLLQEAEKRLGNE